MEANDFTTQKVLLFFVAVLIAILGGIFTGAVVGFIGSLFYLVFLFPLGMGTVGGNILKAGIRLAKIRKISQIIFLSLLVTVSIYGTYHFARYVIFQRQALVALYPKLTNVSSENRAAAAQLLMNYALIKETGHSGFIGYVLYKAQQGVSLGHFYVGTGINLGPILTWLYCLLEFGIIFWVAMSIGKQEVQTPICEVCGSRLGKEIHLGGTTTANESLLLDLLHRRDFLELGKLIEKNETLPSTELYMQRCEACQKGNAHLTVRRAFQGAKGTVQFTDLLNVTLPPTDGVLFSQEFGFRS